MFFFNVPVALVDKSTVKLTDNLNKGNRHLQPLNHLSKHLRQDRAKFAIWANKRASPFHRSVFLGKL